MDIVASSVNMIGQPRVIHKISSTNNPARSVKSLTLLIISWRVILSSRIECNSSELSCVIVMISLCIASVVNNSAFMWHT